MKVYLMSDLEGATGVTRFDNRKNLFHLFLTKSDINQYIENLSYDINAAIEGAVEGGADMVTVCDGHGNNSVLSQTLPSVAHLVKTKSCWMPDLDDSYDALLMVGFHAKAGHNKAVLSHSFSRMIKSVYYCDREIGEIQLCAMIAGIYKIPVVFISGDDCAVNEARSIIPRIRSAIVKYSTSNFTAICLSRKKTTNLIREAVRDALKNRHMISPVQPKPPYYLVREYKLPFVSILRHYLKMQGQSTSVDIFRQHFKDNDFLNLTNKFFGYCEKEN